MLKITGCDYLMVGRAAQGNPFVFSEINAYLRGENYTPPTLEERFKVLLEQVDLMTKYKDPHNAILESRKHTAWYMTGLKGAANLRRMCGEISSISDIEKIIELALEQNKDI
jgi:tRNA-dihydrouridine synthase